MDQPQHMVEFTLPIARPNRYYKENVSFVSSFTFSHFCCEPCLVTKTFMRRFKVAAFVKPSCEPLSLAKKIVSSINLRAHSAVRVNECWGVMTFVAFVEQNPIKWS